MSGGAAVRQPHLKVTSSAFHLYIPGQFRWELSIITHNNLHLTATSQSFIDPFPILLIYQERQINTINHSYSS